MLNQKLNDRNEIPVKAQSTEEIFHAALALSPEERVSYLAQVCEDNRFFRLAVELLIESHEETSNFVDVPAFEAAAEILMEGKQLKEGHMVAHYRCFFAGPGRHGPTFPCRESQATSQSIV